MVCEFPELRASCLCLSVFRPACHRCYAVHLPARLPHRPAGLSDSQ